MHMIFVFDHDDGGLEVFSDEKEAVEACEGIDVEESPYEFWNHNGQSLKAVFTKQNETRTFSVVSGSYRLEPNHDGQPLINILPRVSYVEGNSPLNTIEAVRQHLTSVGSGTP